MSTDLFGGTLTRPLQLIRVTVANDGPAMVRDPGADITVRVEGPGVSTPLPFGISGLVEGEERVAEVPVEIAAPYAAASPRQATVIAESTGGRVKAPVEITVAETGWTMWMVSHFHYDPVWWDTQGQFTESRLLLPDEHGELPEARTAFELVRLHLDEARRDPDYKFVLAEIDYLKPHFDAHPQDRADLRAFIAEGRIEIAGGNYNEPNTNLTSAESTIRNAVYGIGYQRDVLGGDPRSAWMLDAFGHDPGYPGLMAAAGLTSSAWARGPFHQWGPRSTVGGNERMQFPSEFEWISPDGGGLLTSYMPNHYAAGWAIHRAGDLAAAEREAHAQFRSLAQAAATRNVLLPVGADHTIPSRWATEVHRSWNARYVWPRFVTALPREFFAAVRADADRRDIWITPQTRDMNPVYPGKDVTYIDTKQGQRAAETAVADGERLATLAWLAGAEYPAESLDKAWRQLAYGAHHDAITGTESDQVYLDLLGGWREAWQRGDEVRRAACEGLAALADTTAPGRRGASAGAGAIVVFNTLSWARSGLARITLAFGEPGTPWAVVLDRSGTEVPALAEGIVRHADGTLAGVTLTFRAADVPALGYRAYWARAAPEPASAGGWTRLTGTVAENGAFLVEADPERGGTLTRVLDKRTGAELLRPGLSGNELVIQEEYASHPQWGEGPWLLSPRGPGRGSSAIPARVRAERCPIGTRLVAELTIDDLRVTQETLLWDGAERVGFRTHVDGSIGQDRLLRVRFAADVPGGLPLYKTAAAVIGRPLGWCDTDVAEHWFTLDNPAQEWFGIGSTVRVAVTAGGPPSGRQREVSGGRPPRQAQMQAIGVAEVIMPAPDTHEISNGLRRSVRSLVAALASQGVTATCSRADGPRYGAIDLDSNLPDVRIVLGGPEDNPFTAEVLAAADPAYAKEFAERLATDGSARVWVPAARPREEVFVPGADVRGAGDLPVLIVAGEDPESLPAVISGVTVDLADSVIEATAPAPQCPPQGVADVAVALLNRGIPGCVVTPDGTLNISLMRSCSAWPSGVWIDGEKRTAPDGTSFALQHWSHTFEYALAAGPGDWRTAGFTAAGEEYNHGLLACETSVHDGPLPAEASLCRVESLAVPSLPDAPPVPPHVGITALKPRGNPLASGRPGSPSREDGVTVRLREYSGRPTQARVRLLPGITGARLTSLLEDTDGGPLPLRDGAAAVGLPPCGAVTLTLTGGLAGEPVSPPGSSLRTPLGTPSGSRDGIALSEPAQPVFTRYWLHGKGPAPAGNLPVAVHLSPGRAALPPGGDPAPGGAGVRLRVTVACGPESASGDLELVVPPGLAAECDGSTGPLRYDLTPRGHAAWDVRVRSLPGARAGRYFVAARIRDGLGQVLEDASMIAVGEPEAPDLRLPLDQLLPLVEADQNALGSELDLTVAATGGASPGARPSSPRGAAPGPPELTLTPGGRGELTVQVVSGLASPLRGEAQLISPFGTWGVLGPWTMGFSVEPGGSVALRYPVAVPADARPGAHWWALVKIMYFGRVRYTEAVKVTVVL